MSKRRRNNSNQGSGGAGDNLPAPLPDLAPQKQRQSRPQQHWDRINVGSATRRPDIDAVMHYEEMHVISSPLPPPAVMGAYKEVQADIPERMMQLAERQMTMAETQATHRQDLEKKVVGGGTYRSWAGLILGTLIILATIGCGTFLIYNGRETGGIVAIVVALGGLITALIYGNKQQEGQRQQRAKEVPEQPSDRR